MKLFREVPIGRILAIGDEDFMKTEFDRLADEWKRGTVHLSSPSMIAKHSAYQEIVQMGLVAVPLILRDLRKAPTLWFMALRAITGESPIRVGDGGNIDAMRAAWVDWVDSAVSRTAT